MAPPPPGRVIAYAPGSTSNLGPGFDCLGVAFTGEGDRVTAEIAATAGVRVVSRLRPAHSHRPRAEHRGDRRRGRACARGAGASASS